MQPREIITTIASIAISINFFKADSPFDSFGWMQEPDPYKEVSGQ
jgi:hypothetical protein